MNYSDLSDKTIAEEFARRRGLGTDRTAQGLVDRVSAFLRESDLEHRNSIDIALEANALGAERSKPEPAATPEDFAAADDVQQGIGDRRPPTAEELSAMSIYDYVDRRSELHAAYGITQRPDGGLFGSVR